MSGNNPGPSGSKPQPPKKSQFSTVPPPPPNPTEQWRDTDERFHKEVKADKKSFSEGKKRTIGSKSHNELISQAAMGGMLGSVGVVEVELLVVVETQSAPQLGGVVIHHKPFDLSLLPEEPPVDYSKYIQCPHCGRRFEIFAAERHIPQCVEYDHNKDEKENFRKSRSKSVSK